MEGRKQQIIVRVVLFSLVNLQGLFVLGNSQETASQSKNQHITHDSVSKNQSSDVAEVQQLYQEVTTSQDRIFTYISIALGAFLAALTAVVVYLNFHQTRKWVEFEIQLRTANLELILRNLFGRIAPLYQMFSTAFLSENPGDSDLWATQKRLLRIATEMSNGDLFLQARNLIAAKDAFSRAQVELGRINGRTRQELQDLGIIPSIPQMVTALNVAVLNLHGVQGFEDDRDALIALRSEMMSRFL